MPLFCFAMLIDISFYLLLKGNMPLFFVMFKCFNKGVRVELHGIFFFFLNVVSNWYRESCKFTDIGIDY